MQLNQFDKLTSAIEKLIQNYRELKYQIVELEKENHGLRNKLDLMTENSDELDMDKFIGLKNENERLNKKNQKVRKHLEHLVGNLENQEMQL